jgi:hypothetical protein
MRFTSLYLWKSSYILFTHIQHIFSQFDYPLNLILPLTCLYFESILFWYALFIRKKLRNVLPVYILRVILCKNQRIPGVLRNGMSQIVPIFTIYISFWILYRNIKIKIGKNSTRYHGNQKSIFSIFVHFIKLKKQFFVIFLHFIA